MNPLEKLLICIKKEFPKANLMLDPAKKKDASWWLDVVHNERAITIEWKPKKGFGLWAPSNEFGYGQGPDEIYTDLNEIYDRISILLNKGRGN